MIDPRLLLGLPGIFAQGPLMALTFYWRFVRVKVVPLAPNLYALLSGGSNTTVLFNGDKALVIDTKFPPQARHVPRFLKERGKAPEIIINTHHHYDHTHGNPLYPPGVRVIAHENALANMQRLDQGFWSKSPASQLAPSETFSSSMTLEYGGTRLSLHYLGPAHTSGDLVVMIPERGIACVGDLLFHGHYPLIDLRGGADIRGWVAAIDQVLDMGPEVVVPGHGAIASGEGLRRFRSYLAELYDQVEERVGEGESLSSIRRSVRLPGYSDFEPVPYHSGYFIKWATRQQNVQWAWEQVTRASGS